jgi:hypothetical protein
MKEKDRGDRRMKLRKRKEGRGGRQKVKERGRRATSSREDEMVDK